MASVSISETVIFSSHEALNAAGAALVFYRESLKKCINDPDDDAEAKAYWNERLAAVEQAMRDFRLMVHP